MEIETKTRERCTKERGMAFVDKLGWTQAAFHVDTFQPQGFSLKLKFFAVN